MITFISPTGGPPLCLEPMYPSPNGLQDRLLIQDQDYLWRIQRKSAWKREKRFIKEYPKDRNPLSDFEAVKTEGVVTFGWQPEVGWGLISGKKGFGYRFDEADQPTSMYLNVRDSGMEIRNNFFVDGEEFFTRYDCRDILYYEDDRHTYEEIHWALSYFSTDRAGNTFLDLTFYTIVIQDGSDQCYIGSNFMGKSWAGKPDGNPSFDHDDVMKFIKQKLAENFWFINGRVAPDLNFVVAEPPPFVAIFDPVPFSTRLLDFINHVLINLARHRPSLEDFDKSLFEEAVANSRPDTSNWLETAIGSKALLPSIIASIAKVQGGILGTIQRFAGIYLFYLYGLRPIPSDIKNLRNAISIAQGLKSYPEWTFSSTKEMKKEEWSGTQTAFIKCRGINRDGFDPMDSNLSVGSLATPKGYVKGQLNRNLNLMADAGVPTDFFSFASMLWDLLPLSFVVDWFFDLGGWLDAVSLRHYYDRLPILYSRRAIHVERDEKLVIIEQAQIMGLEVPNSSVKSEYYIREYSSSPPALGPPKLGDPRYASHWIELAAIVVTRLK